MACRYVKYAPVQSCWGETCAVEEAVDTGVSVLQVGRGVAVEGQHPVPVEDVVLDPVSRQLGVLQRTQTYRRTESAHIVVGQVG